MTRNIRLVKTAADGKVRHVSMNTAVRDLIRQVIASQPSAVFVAWEADGDLNSAALPASVVLMKGMVHTLYVRYFEESDDTGTEE